MLSENQKRLIQSNKKIAISVQTISENVYRTNFKILKKFEGWLRLEKVDEEGLDYFLEWAKNLIENNLQSYMMSKNLMQKMITDQMDSFNNPD